MHTHDREHDDEREPWLGATTSFDQLQWTAGGMMDLEEQCEDEGAQCEDEGSASYVLD